MLFAPPGYHKNAVTHLDFSPDGKLLLSVGMDADNSVAIYDWERGTKVFSNRLSKDGLFACRFASSGNFFATSSPSNISFWLPKGGNHWTRQKGIFGKMASNSPIVSLTAFAKPNQILGGSSSGHVLLWEGRNCVQAFKGHDQAVTDMFYHAAGNLLLTGSKDRKVKLWNTQFLPLAVMDTLSLPSPDPSIRSLSLSKDGRRILLGTTAGEIYEISAVNEAGEEGEDGIKRGADLNGGPLVCGHFKGKVGGLAVNPSGTEFVTVGEDKMLSYWDREGHKLKKALSFDSTPNTAAFSPDGGNVVIGFGAGKEEKEVKEGALVIINLEDMSEISFLHDSHEAILDTKYSSDGFTIAAGSNDKGIYLYRQTEGAWKLHLKIEKFEGPVAHLDFSSDGAWIRATSMERELRFVNTETGEELEDLAQFQVRRK